jgi:hypothetical protein
MTIVGLVEERGDTHLFSTCSVDGELGMNLGSQIECKLGKEKKKNEKASNN